jgi:hypothetical protein
MSDMTGPVTAKELEFIAYVVALGRRWALFQDKKNDSSVPLLRTDDEFHDCVIAAAYRAKHPDENVTNSLSRTKYAVELGLTARFTRKVIVAADSYRPSPHFDPDFSMLLRTMLTGHP